MNPVKISTTFGAWVQTRRKQLDLTQSGLGKLAGCSEAAIRKIEANERKPSRQLAELLAQVLEIPGAEREGFIRFSRGIFSEETHIETRANLHNLPALLTSTVDRTRDLTTVLDLLKDKTVHLVTLIGPPGIGKTRLSIHCGNELLDDFPDGVWFVDLADVASADFFAHSVARFLPNFNPPPSPNLFQLVNGLRDKSLLLILDNFEHIVEEASLDVAHILKACHNLKVLVTSRIPLHIYGENEFPLQSLSVPPWNVERIQSTLMEFESVQLFVARTRQHQPQFAVTTHNASAVIEICTILEGIPLALELAAASLRKMTVNEMAVLLRGNGWVNQISTPARDLPQRQRTLENVIDWNYTLLDAEQKEFFCKLGIFSNRFDADAAAAICETNPPQVGELLEVLTDHSLLVREVFKGKNHWRMLELIHEYAVSKLNQAQRSQVERLRAEYFLYQIQEFKHNAPRELQEEYFQNNFSNFHDALQWSIQERQTGLGLELAVQLEGVWSSLGYFREGLDLLRQLLALPANVPPAIRAKYLQTASDLAWQQHDFQTALAYSEEAVNLGRIHNLKREYPSYLNRLGRIYIEQGKLAEAKEILQKALALASEDPSFLNPGFPLAQLGEAALFEGSLEEAKPLFEKALFYLKSEDKIFIAIATTDLAEVALAQDDFLQTHFWLEKAFLPACQQVRRLMVFLSALAGYLTLSDCEDKKIATQFYGALDALSESSGVLLGAFYLHLNQKRIKLTRAKLSTEEWLEAFESGRGWGRGETLDQARKVLGL